MKSFSINLNILIAFLPCLIFGPAAWAQDSILAQILRYQESIVGVTSENYDVFASPPQIAGIDKRTGRIAVSQNVAQQTFNRNGAGVIIHPSGVIVTNAHVVHKANRIKITLFDKTVVYADVIRFIGNLDFCLLKIDPPFPLDAIPFADSDAIQLRDEIITVGSSYILNNTVSGGQVKGLGTTRLKSGHRVDLIHTTFNLYEGDSGGPLFNDKGELLGLMTAKETDADHSSFAIPSNKIWNYLMEYLNETNVQ